MQDALVLHSTDGVDVTLPIAGIGSRSYAFIIDWHIRLLLAVAWALAAMKMLEWVPAIERASIEAGLSYFFYVVWLPAMVIYWLYHPIVEVVMRGSTPGKRMVGVRIVTSDGHTPGVGALLIRNIFRLVDSLPFFYFLGLGVAIATARQVRIGDLAAGTLLVYEERIARLDLDAHLSGNSLLGPKDLDWLQDLLERWKSLDAESRRRLAARFLERVEGMQLEPWLRDDDIALHTRLISLAEGTREASAN